jgi:hypothetical protein
MALSHCYTIIARREGADEAMRFDEERAVDDLMAEERNRCRKFWLKFRILERIQLGSLFVPLLLLWAFPNIGARIPRTLGEP